MVSPLGSSISGFKIISDVQNNKLNSNLVETQRPDYTVQDPLASIYGVPNYDPSTHESDHCLEIKVRKYFREIWILSDGSKAGGICL